MFDALKELSAGCLLTIDDRDVIELTDSQDYEIIATKSYSQEEGEILFIDLDGFMLVAHTFDGKPHYYIYELNASGSEDDLTDKGFRLVFKDDMMPNKLYAGEIPYRTTVGPIYSLNPDQDDTPDLEYGELSLCEYRGKTKLLTHILLEKHDATFTLYQGFRISGSDLVL